MNRRATLPTGKVPVDLLRTLLGRFAATKDSRVLVGPGIGLDAAAVRIGGRVHVAKTDPITLVVDEIGTKPPGFAWILGSTLWAALRPDLL